MATEERLILKARAKINLCLNVTGKEGDKHALDTIIFPVGLSDEVVMEKSPSFLLTYDGKVSPYDDDVVVRAVNLLKSYFDGGIKVDIKKRIPEKAGIGGSSADAAAVVKGLETLYGFTVDGEVLERIGSDVPAMYFGSPCRMVGTGKTVLPVDAPETIRFVLVTGATGVSTKNCFDLYDKIGGERGDVEDVLKKLSSGEYFTPVNALERSAKTLSPEIGEVLTAVKKSGFYGGMTGSGSGVFGYEYSETAFSENLAKLKTMLSEKYRITTF